MTKEDFRVRETAGAFFVESKIETFDPKGDPSWAPTNSLLNVPLNWDNPHYFDTLEEAKQAIELKIKGDKYHYL